MPGVGPTIFTPTKGLWVDTQFPVLGNPSPGKLFAIAGVTKDSTGVALAACTVTLFRTGSNVQVDQVVSDGSGNYSFPNVSPGSSYYVVAYKAGAPDVAGTTVNTLIGV